ncbi:MAG TPA: CPBP family intramembrane glutamic endopeptidase [Anaerolineales bacterium]|nr:CPBP family intramembrane glutamic endopeptidase [Anaerolineales bacterium]
MSVELTCSTEKLAKKEHSTALQPLGALSSLVLFGLPAVLLFAAFHAFRPWLESLGHDPLTSYLASLCVPLALLFSAALIAYHKVEGRLLTWQAFSERMRLPHLRWRDVLWGLVIFVIGGISIGLLSGLIRVLTLNGWIPLPSNLPSIADPRAALTLDTLIQAAGGMIRGRWDIAVLFLVTFFFNIAGEELWWRGYILPRQELAFGRKTWLIHGLLWAGFHVFKWWDLLPLLPICLLTAYCAQRTRSTWGALIGHALTNGLGLIAVLLVIAG